MRHHQIRQGYERGLPVSPLGSWPWIGDVQPTGVLQRCFLFQRCSFLYDNCWVSVLVHRGRREWRALVRELEWTGRPFFCWSSAACKHSFLQATTNKRRLMPCPFWFHRQCGVLQTFHESMQKFAYQSSRMLHRFRAWLPSSYIPCLELWGVEHTNHSWSAWADPSNWLLSWGISGMNSRFFQWRS